MRIAYLTADFGVPVLGTKGASTHVCGVVRALRRLGHEVLVLTANAGYESQSAVDFRLTEVRFGGALREVYEALTEERLCQRSRLPKDLRNILFSLNLELQGRLILGEFRPDVLYERSCLLSTAGVELAGYFGVPLILEVNAPLVLEQQKVRGLSLPTVARAAERLKLTRADHVIVVSSRLREYVTAEGVSADCVSVIPNGADPDLFHPRSGFSELRQRLGWHDQFVIGFVGSMKPWHGIATLLEALHRLGGPEGSFRLLLVGSGPELPALRQQVERCRLDGCVHMTGDVPHARVPEMLHAMDCVVASYAADADEYFSPVKLFEYMAMGCPVVAARVGQACEVIDHGRTGWLYCPGNPSELADVLAAVSADDARRREVGAAAREQVLARYTWQHNGRRVLAIAERLLARRSAASAGSIRDQGGVRHAWHA
jgi:glycosyltransferase involved in cell wall biosynthesis